MKEAQISQPKNLNEKLLKSDNSATKVHEGHKKQPQLSSKSAIVRWFFPTENFSKVMNIGNRGRFSEKNIFSAGDDLLYKDYSKFEAHLQKQLKKKTISFHKIHNVYLWKENLALSIIYFFR